MNSTHIPATQRLLGLFTLLLTGVTWPLWQPDASQLDQQIPWLNWVKQVPESVDLMSLTGLGLSAPMLIFASATSKLRRFSQVCYVGFFALLVLFDQHRLQPWVLQFMLFGCVLSLAPNSSGWACCRWIVASIYFYSAVSKFDTTFLEAHGQLLLEGLLKPFQLNLSLWSEKSRYLLALFFPVGELAIAMLLLWNRTRKIGLMGACVMHLMILLALGPWGLNHEYGVLMWNLYFIAQNLLLFANSLEPRPLRTRVPAADLAAYLFTGLVLFLPILENFGLYDHWPAWAVYSARPARVAVYIDASAAKDLPPDLQQLCGVPAPLDERVPFLLDRWSFTTRYCPIYPQLRYRLAIAYALLSEHLANDEITIEIGLTPNRWTGTRQSIVLPDKLALREFLLEEFLVNTTARRPAAAIQN